MRTGRLKARVVKVEALDASARGLMWTVFCRYYADIDQARFEADLARKKDVILLEDSGDGSLQGFSTIEVYDRVRDGRKFLAVFSGDTIIEKAYWGQSALQRAFVRYVVTLKIKRPLTPVYWFLISKGYKTYLLLSRNFTSYWPRHDAPTPVWEQGLVDFLATEKYPDDYVQDRGVLHFSRSEGRLKSGIAPIDPTLLQREDVRFFIGRNPRHADGDELCCLGKVDAGLWARFSGRLLNKVLARTLRTARRLWALADTPLF